MLPNIEDKSPWPSRQRFLFVQHQMCFPLIHLSRSLSLDHSCVWRTGWLGVQRLRRMWHKLILPDLQFLIVESSFRHDLLHHWRLLFLFHHQCLLLINLDSSLCQTWLCTQLQLPRNELCEETRNMVNTMRYVTMWMWWWKQMRYTQLTHHSRS